MSIRKRLEKARLYLILDTQVNTYVELFEIARQAIEAGVDIIQLRDKQGTPEDMVAFAQRVRPLCRDRVLFVLNDRVDLVGDCQAHGVHVGQEDTPVPTVIDQLGRDILLGASCQTLEQAARAQAQGADYIGWGSVFKTLTKPDRSPMDSNLLREVATGIQIPVFAIGGITLGNVESILKLGVSRVAVCRSVCLAANVAQTVKAFKEILEGQGAKADLL